VLAAAAACTLMGIASTHASSSARVAGICGDGDSEVAVYNYGAVAPAAITIDTVSQASGIRSVFSLGPTWYARLGRFALSEQPFLAFGSYAVSARSISEIAAVARTSWPDCGGLAIDNGSDSSTDVVVPFAVRYRSGETSIVAIQNTDTSESIAATLTLYETGRAAPAFTTVVSIQPARSVTLDLYRSPEFFPLPSGFEGWIRVTASAPVAVQSWIDTGAQHPGVYGFEGAPAAAAESVLAAPLVYADAPLDPDDPTAVHLNSRIAVVNPETSGASVGVQFYGTSGTCAGQSYDTPPIALAGGTSLVLELPAAAALGPGGLPRGCLASAIIRANEGAHLVATVLSSGAGGSLASAYNAQGRPHNNTFIIPWWRNSYGSARLTTAVQVVNMGDIPTFAQIHLSGACGSIITDCADCDVSLAPNQAHLWWPERTGSIAAGTSGMAQIGCNTTSCVAAVSEVPLAAGSDMAAYVDLRYPVQRQPPRFPLLLRGSVMLPTPTPPVCPTTTSPVTTETAIASDTPSATPTAMSSLTPTPTATVTPTSGPTPVVPSCVCPRLGRRVPQVVILAALANPQRYNGWLQPLDPGKPPGPTNPLRECLDVRNPGSPYHPLFNGVYWRVGCR
jgi:hypothetical protein